MGEVVVGPVAVSSIRVEDMGTNAFEGSALVSLIRFTPPTPTALSWCFLPRLRARGARPGLRGPGVPGARRGGCGAALGWAAGLRPDVRGGARGHGHGAAEQGAGQPSWYFHLQEL